MPDSNRIGRPVKYRVWDGAKMLPVETLCFSPGGVMWFSGMDRGYGWSNPEFPWTPDNLPPDKIDHLMAYTGLKDRNGCEIWEGDIIRYPRDTPSVHQGDPRYSISVVEYRTDGLGSLRAGFEIGGDYAWDDTTEVIGNIHDNPELLKS